MTDTEVTPRADPGAAGTGAEVRRPRYDMRAEQPTGQARRAGLRAAAGSVAAGAAKGAVAGGGLHGAIVGAAKSFLRTPAGRRLVAVLVVVAVAAPLGGLLMLVSLVGAVSPLQEDTQVQAASQRTVLSSTQIGEDDLGVLTDVARSAGVPWQVLAALTTSPGGGGGNPGGIADVIVPDDMTCPPSGLAAERGLTPDALLVLRCGAHQFPELTTWGGVGDRTNNPNSDHPAGRAVDAMIPDWDTPEGNELGWQVANWYRANADALGIRYVLFDAQQWTVGDADWGPYSHPSGASNPTLDHRDHVHVSVLAEGQAPPTGGGGTGGGPSTGGWGPFGISPDAGLNQAQAEDLRTAADWVAANLAGRMSGTPTTHRSLGTGVAVLADGTLTVAVSADQSTGAPGEYINDDMAAAAAVTQQAWSDAIAALDVVGMTEQRAEQVFTTARNWFLGIASGGGSTCVPGPGGTGVTELGSRTTEGVPITLNAAQLQVASVIIDAAEEAGVGQAGAIVGLMTALQESTLRNHANDGSDPRLTAHDRAVVVESMNFPNDGIGSDWDSVNPFQQRPSQGWGTVAELMDPGYAAATFFDRLVQVEGWQEMPPTQAAQRVQRSAFPDAYAKWEPVARDIVAQVGGSSCGGAPVFSAEGWTNPVPGARITSGYNLARVHPITGVVIKHAGTDLAAPLGTAILAAQDGVVVAVRGCQTGCMDSEYGISGFLVAVDHGGGVVTTYNHIQAGAPVQVGQQVSAGDVIAHIGMSGMTTGPHLHFQVFVNGETVDPEVFMPSVGVTLGQ